MKPKKYYSKAEALAALQRYCAYQDRCHKEVRSKLLSLGIYGMDLEDIMVQLIEEKFLDEERFARSFARGKFRMKHWGRRRIVQELKKRDISEYCIRKALTEIDEEEYSEALRQVLHKRFSLASGNKYERRKKATEAALRRGYEPELVFEEGKKLIEE
ncbi:MAG: RecX family transcriptional regulator [Bacteroidetes bacterium]|nr:MAG: RecX family transcriptional regulator [Bacteroidota bacterium]